jgi:HD-GYP domain
MRVPLNELLLSFSTALDFVEKDLLGTTTNHGKRAAYVSSRICRAMGLSEVEIFDMTGCAILHDNALTEYLILARPFDLRILEQFEIHCLIGERNAKAFPFVGNIDNVILEHHENWNGSGFHGLIGDEIPVRSAALRLADNMDLELAMGDGRPTLGKDIQEHARKYAGSIYSPEAVETLLENLDDEFLRNLGDDRIEDALREEMPGLNVELNAGQLLEACELFALIIDAKSPFTKNHSKGVAELTRRVSLQLGIDDERIQELTIAAYLHDLGKLSVPLHLLEKPGPLTSTEFHSMLHHSEVTAQLLGKVRGLDHIARWCETHHEKLNGSGYPYGIRAPKLTFESQIIAVCDIYQALTEDRPYRDSLSQTEAFAILGKMVAQGELNPEIVSKIIEMERVPHTPPGTTPTRPA